MQITRDHIDADRYHFDAGLCSFKRGFAQVDTGQDAWYFGTWANPTTLTVVSYAEGDVTIEQADTPQEFGDALRAVKRWNDVNGYSFGIDTMCQAEIREGFQALGLADLCA